MDGIVPLFANHLTGEERHFYEKVWKLLSDSHSYVDLESVFPVIDTISRNYSFDELGPVSAFHIRKYFQLHRDAGESRPLQSDVELAGSIREKFRKFIRSEYQVRPNEQGKIDAVYSQFFSLLTKRPGYDATSLHGKLSFRSWPMFTTNYDLNIESVFANHDANLNTGAVPSQTGQFMILDTSQLDTGTALRPPRPMLVKLHGSLNWLKLAKTFELNLVPQTRSLLWMAEKQKGKLCPIQL